MVGVAATTNRVNKAGRPPEGVPVQILTFSYYFAATSDVLKQHLLEMMQVPFRIFQNFLSFSCILADNEEVFKTGKLGARGDARE